MISCCTPSASRSFMRTSRLLMPGTHSKAQAAIAAPGGVSRFPPSSTCQPPSSKKTRGARSFSSAGNRSAQMSPSSQWLSAETTTVPAGSSGPSDSATRFTASPMPVIFGISSTPVRPIQRTPHLPVGLVDTNFYCRLPVVSSERSFSERPVRVSWPGQTAAIGGEAAVRASGAMPPAGRAGLSALVGKAGEDGQSLAYRTLARQPRRPRLFRKLLNRQRPHQEEPERVGDLIGGQAAVWPKPRAQPGLRAEDQVRRERGIGRDELARLDALADRRQIKRLVALHKAVELGLLLG